MECKFILLLLFCYLSFNQLHYKSILKQFNIFAFIRVKNEAKTLLLSLNSILQFTTEGIIAYNECDDGSEKIIIDFCKKHKKYYPFYYPYWIIRAGSKYYHDNQHFENRLDTYYNTTLKKIPPNRWVMKIDCDQIYDSENVIESLKLISSKNDFLTFPKVNLHIYNKKIYIGKFQPITNPGDQYLFFYDCSQYFVMDITNSHSYEILVMKKKRKKRGLISIFHFPFLKTYRKIINISKWGVELHEWKKKSNNSGLYYKIIKVIKNYNLI